jgi:hypothetical protein
MVASKDIPLLGLAHLYPYLQIKGIVFDNDTVYTLAVS